MRHLAHLLARLLPRDLRRAHGDELHRDIDRRCRDGRTWSTLTDVAAAVVRERRHAHHPLPPGAQRRPVRMSTMMQMLVQDVRYAVRLFTRQPGFTLAVMLTLGLGIGSATAVLSLADATLLRPIAAHDPDRLAEMPWSVSFPDYQEFSRRADGFDGMLAFANLGAIGLDAGGTTERVAGTLVSANYFSVLGIAPSAGRLLTDEDDRAAGVPSIVISHRLWRSSFGSDPAAVGRTVRVNGRSAVVVGVAAPGFRGISLANLGDIWMPAALAPQLATGFLGNPRILSPNFSWLRVVGRLSPGVTLPQASERLAGLYNDLHPAEPGAERDPLQLRPLAATAVGGDRADDLRRFITLLFVVAGILLVLGCANVANLLLARAAARRQEIGVRVALGAGRARLIGQLLVESALLGTGGAIAGLAIASICLRILGRYQLPGGLSIASLAPGINAMVLWLAIGITALAVVIFGLVPAIVTSRRDVHTALRAGGRTATRTPLSRALVTVQVALSVAMVGGGLLFARGLERGLGFDLGYRPEHVVMTTADPSLERLPAERTTQYLIDALNTLAANGAIAHAGASSTRPMRGSMSMSFHPVGYVVSTDEDLHVAVNLVSTGWFEALGIPIAAGRAFAAEDGGSVRSAIVSESLARKYWPGENAVGKQIATGTDPGDPIVTVIGVAGDARYGAVDAEPQPYLYLPLHSDFGGPFRSQLHFFVRSTLPPGTALATLRQALIAADERVPLSSAMTLDGHVADALMPQRLGLVLLTAFAVAALVLAAAGVYAVAAYTVAARRREIGIRMALGADRRRVLGQVLRDGAAPVVLGAVAGAAVQAWGARLAERFVFGLDGTDPLQLAGAALIVLLAAAAALVVPARAAARTEPTVALRE